MREEKIREEKRRQDNTREGNIRTYKRRKSKHKQIIYKKGCDDTKRDGKRKYDNGRPRNEPTREDNNK